MTTYPFIGKHKSDRFVVRFTSENTGKIIASAHRFGDKSTNTEGTFDEARFNTIWKSPKGQTAYDR